MDALLNTLGPVGVGLLALFAFAVIVLGVMYAFWNLARPTRTAKDRLEEFTGGPKEDDALTVAIAERISQISQPNDQESRNELRTKLVQAGFRNRRAPDLFNFSRIALGLGAPVVLTPVLLQLPSWPAVGVATSVLALVGYLLPTFVLRSNISRRQKALLQPFPDALDLLCTSVEAGLGVDAAFRRVAQELETAAPELAIEFQLVNHEISAGLTRVEALKHLADRTGLDEVKSLVNMLAQAERFGTSIARSLRVHSEISRAKRMARAEEQAAKVSPKLTVVMILFLLPCLLVVLLGPAIVRVKNTFTNNFE